MGQTRTRPGSTLPPSPTTMKTVTSLVTTPAEPPDPVYEIDEMLLADMLAILAEGERRERDNALYPLMTASLLYAASTTLKDDNPQPTTARGEGVLVVGELVVRNPARHAAARRPHCPHRRQAGIPQLFRRADSAAARCHSRGPQVPDLSMRARVERNEGAPVAPRGAARPGRRQGSPDIAGARQGGQASAHRIAGRCPHVAGTGRRCRRSGRTVRCPRHS